MARSTRRKFLTKGRRCGTWLLLFPVTRTGRRRTPTKRLLGHRTYLSERNRSNSLASSGEGSADEATSAM